MMILTSRQLEDAISNGVEVEEEGEPTVAPLIEHADIGQIEAGAYDLRVGAVGKLLFRSDAAWIGSGKGPDQQRHLWPADPCMMKESKRKRELYWEFDSGDTYLITTMERLNVPRNLRGQLFARITTNFCAVQAEFGRIAPGFRGPLTFVWHCRAWAPVQIGQNAGICAVEFALMNEIEGDAYRNWRPKK